MATIDVKDAGGTTQTIERPLAPGRAAATSSRPVVLATEDLAALTSIATGIGATTEAAAASDGATSGLNGLIKRIAGHLTNISGRLLAPNSGSQSSVSASTSDTSLLASNASRKGATIFNDSSAVLYVLLASGTSSVTAFTVRLEAGAYYELPVCQGGVYTGAIKGIWASATGSARVTELA